VLTPFRPNGPFPIRSTHAITIQSACTVYEFFCITWDFARSRDRESNLHRERKLCRKRARAREKETERRRCSTSERWTSSFFCTSSVFFFFLRRRYYVVALNDEHAARSVGTRQLSLLTLNWSKLLQLDVITRRRRGTSAMFLSFSFSFSLCRKYHQRDVTILKLSSCQPLSISYF